MNGSGLDIIARIETPFAEKFGVPRQSGIADCPACGCRAIGRRIRRFGASASGRRSLARNNGGLPRRPGASLPDLRQHHPGMF